MQISAISNINFKQNPKVENNPPKDEQKGLSTTSKALIGVGVVAAGTLAVYFITRNGKAAKNVAENLPKPKTNEAPKAKPEPVKQKTKPTAKPTDKNSKEIKDLTPKEILEKIDEKITKALEGFKSDFTDLSERLITPMKNGKTKVIYSGKNTDGKEFKDIVIFDGENNVFRRIVEEITPATKEKYQVIYAGDNSILTNPEAFSEGKFNPKYFQKQITKYKFEKQGREVEGVPDSIFYSQTTHAADNKGVYKEITRRYKTDGKSIKSIKVNDGSVELKLNPQSNKYEFNWDTKKELNTKSVGVSYDEKDNINGIFTRQGKINGEDNKNDYVVLKYNDKKYGIVYSTHNEMFGHEPNVRN